MEIDTNLCEWKEEPTRLRKEHKWKQPLHEVKDILLEVVLDVVLNNKAFILDQLVQIVDKMNDPNIDTQSLLVKRNEKRFEN